MRRLHQPSKCPSRGNEFVDYLFCGVPSDSEEEEGNAKLTRTQAGDGICLYILMVHLKAKHKGEMLTEGRSLLDMGFNLHFSPIVEDADIEAVELYGLSSLTTTIEHLRESVAAQTEQPPPRPSTRTSIFVVVVESGTLLDNNFGGV